MRKVYLSLRTLRRSERLMWAQRLSVFTRTSFPPITLTHGALPPLTFSLAACLCFFPFPFPPFYEWFSLAEAKRRYPRIPRRLRPPRHDLTASAHLLRSSSRSATRTFTAASDALGGNITPRRKTWSCVQPPRPPSTWVWKLTQSQTTTFPSRRRWVEQKFGSSAAPDRDPLRHSLSPATHSDLHQSLILVCRLNYQPLRETEAVYKEWGRKWESKSTSIFTNVCFQWRLAFSFTD